MMIAELWHLFMVLNFYCCVTNHKKHSSLKHQPSLSSQFYRVEIRALCGWVLCWGLSAECLTKQKFKYQLQCSSRAQSSLTSSLVFGRIQSFVVVGLRSLFSCWLGNLSQLPGAVHYIAICFLPGQQGHSLMSSFATSRRKLSILKKLTWTEQAHSRSFPFCHIT